MSISTDPRPADPDGRILAVLLTLTLFLVVVYLSAVAVDIASYGIAAWLTG